MIDSVSEEAGGFDGLKKARRGKAAARPDTQTDRLPPHAPEAEQGVIGCVLLAPSDVLPGLIERRYSPLWNYDLRHQHIMQVVLHLYLNEKDKAIDIITVQQKLKDLQLLEQVGGIPYLNSLQDCVPSPSNWRYYCEIVQEKWQLRQIITFCTDMVGKIYEFEGDVSEVLQLFERDTETLTSPMREATERHIKEVIQTQVIPQIERHYSRGSTQLDGLPTGMDYLDKVLLGIAPTDYMVLAARPSEGKTSLALNIVDHLSSKYVWFEEITEQIYQERLAAGQAVIHNRENNKYFIRGVGIPIGVFTLEMTEDSLGFRLVFSHAKVSSGSFRQGFATEGDFTNIQRSVEELCKTNIYLDGEADQSIDMIAAKARRMARQYGIKLFVLDYLQLMDSENDPDRVRVIRQISKKIVSLKKRLKVPWLVIAQMNRNIETAERARRPVMSDLKECGSIEQDADKIVFLYHPLKGEGIEEDEEKIAAIWERKKLPVMDTPRRINALVAKNRNGPTGVATLLFQNNQCLFHDWRQWQLANGLAEYAKGESKSRNPEELPSNEDLGFPPVSEEEKPRE